MLENCVSDEYINTGVSLEEQHEATSSVWAAKQWRLLGQQPPSPHELVPLGQVADCKDQPWATER